MVLVKVKQRHNPTLILGIPARLQQRMTIMKRKTDQLLTTRHNFLIAESAGFCKGEMIVVRILH